MEHGDEMKLSRAQRREVMSIPVNFQLRGRGEEDSYDGGADAQQMNDRPGEISCRLVDLMSEQEVEFGGCVSNVVEVK